MKNKTIMKVKRIAAKCRIAACVMGLCLGITQLTMAQEGSWEIRTISWNSEWEYAEHSEIHEQDVKLYLVDEKAKTVAVNAGHGCSGGWNVQTLCHPDGSAKVTGGSTASGSTYATAISSGTEMLDGTAESTVTLSLALLVRDRLLENGFNVLMIREDADAQLDNIARTVFSNQNADCHIALHYDSSENDKGFFYIGVPDVASYRAMEPVASHWMEHEKLGTSILQGMQTVGVKVYGGGNVPLDLTQTSYSTIPSVDLEVGDRGSDYSEATQSQIADAIAEGLKLFFEPDKGL